VLYFLLERWNVGTEKTPNIKANKKKSKNGFNKKINYDELFTLF